MSERAWVRIPPTSHHFFSISPPPPLMSPPSLPYYLLHLLSLLQPPPPRSHLPLQPPSPASRPTFFGRSLSRVTTAQTLILSDPEPTLCGVPCPLHNPSPGDSTTSSWTKDADNTPILYFPPLPYYFIASSTTPTPRSHLPRSHVPTLPFTTPNISLQPPSPASRPRSIA